ncbi:peptidoglycan recognition protein family protein [Streptomyces cellostaticus]|uniref:peptidoglycan recognition protein family protein n=1 Tax=Streptomyces cellostaticus TaxID=67285 RepID=UPI002026CB3F|nr:N-acetylmuramoyl-L-alanine amidase [Streptomyces cellostaticus]
MRGFLGLPAGITSIGVTCAVALVLPLAPPATAAAPPGGSPAGAAVPGGTQSLPLAPLGRERTPGAVPERGLYRTGVRHFSLVGVIWDDPDAALRGTVQVRTRSAASGAWSGWQDVETHNEDHGADPATAERSSGRVRGATAPLWVGDSDGVDVRVRADSAPDRAVTDRGRGGDPSPALPSGLRLELVDPGGGTSARTRADSPRALPALSRPGTEPETDRPRAEGEPGAAGGRAPQVKPYIGPRPGIVTRRGWGADESLRERAFVYTTKVKAAFVHHTSTGNNYSCSQAPSVIRGIYRYHVKSMGWRDIGYNFLVDKCGTIYEGRAGGVALAVLGAHTLGFNSNSMGVAVIGSYGSSKPSGAAVTAVAKLTAWKLGLFGADPRGKTYLTSGGGNRYPKGKSVRLNVISGHRDGFATSCPGARLYAKLGSARSSAARYQGR